MDYLLYIVAGLTILNSVAIGFIFLKVLPDIESGTKQLGAGLAELGKRVQDFAAFMAGKL